MRRDDLTVLGREGGQLSSIVRCDEGGMAADKIRQLLSMAAQLLRRDQCRESDYVGDRALRQRRAERVARLREELHVTANRVARFDVEDFPFIPPVRASTPPHTPDSLAPDYLLGQLEQSAQRLLTLLDRQTSADWSRECRMGTRQITLGELVGSVLRDEMRDLSELLEDEPIVDLRGQGRDPRRRRVP